MPVSPVGNWSLISASGGEPEAASGLQRTEFCSERVPPEGQEATGTALMPALESHFLPKAECEEVAAFTKGKVLLIQEIVESNIRILGSRTSLFEMDHLQNPDARLRGRYPTDVITPLRRVPEVNVIMANEGRVNDYQEVRERTTSIEIMIDCLVVPVATLVSRNQGRQVCYYNAKAVGENYTSGFTTSNTARGDVPGNGSIFTSEDRRWIEEALARDS